MQVVASWCLNRIPQEVQEERDKLKFDLLELETEVDLLVSDFPDQALILHEVAARGAIALYADGTPTCTTGSICTTPLGGPYWGGCGSVDSNGVTELYDNLSKENVPTVDDCAEACFMEAKMKSTFARGTPV